MITESNPVVYRVGTLVYTKRTLAGLFVWLLWGDVCYMLMESVVPSILPLRFQQLGASNTTIALIMTTIPSIMNAVLNPIISFTSDRHRGKFGRRIPFILATLPFLVLSLIGLGYANTISVWLMTHFGHGHVLTARTLAIWTIAVFMIAFSYFNSFVGSVFWYLFNDVVPESLLARFMSLFRLISMLSASVYNIFIFQYAGAHAPQIMLGVALLYFFGFGLMCLRVKEGQYPPPPAYVGGKANGLSAVKTFAKECLSLPHYWLIFLVTVFGVLAGSGAVFQLFYFESTGLNLAQIGRVNGAVNIAVAALVPISGWLADRYHPLRIVIAGYLLMVCVSLPASLVWLFWHPNPGTAFVVWMVLNAGLGAPVMALLGVFDPPLFMVIFPRSRYGQFCSANAMLRSLASILGGSAVGVFYDAMKHYLPARDVYRLMPIWQLLFTVPGLLCCILLYRSWKGYGGDGHYVPPVPGETRNQRLAEEIPESLEESPAHF